MSSDEGFILFRPLSRNLRPRKLGRTWNRSRPVENFGVSFGVFHGWKKPVTSRSISIRNLLRWLLGVPQFRPQQRRNFRATTNTRGPVSVGAGLRRIRRCKTSRPSSPSTRRSTAGPCLWMFCHLCVSSLNLRMRGEKLAVIVRGGEWRLMYFKIAEIVPF